MKYSVIIPIYNAEKTLKRCLDSILLQLNNDIEIILVNDGSTDMSGAICKEYVAKSSSFRYYEQPNSGVSVARNTGINEATGEYIVFIDSDDYVSDNMFFLISSTLEKYNYDCVVFSTVVKYENSEQIKTLTPFIAHDVDTIIPKIVDMICKKQINSPIDKVYKKSILNHYMIRFPEGCSISEDRAFNISYSLHINSLLITEKHYYYIERVTANSLSRTIKSTEELGYSFKIERDYIESALLNCDLDNKYISQIKAANDFCKCRQVYSRAKRMRLCGESKTAILSGIRNDCAEINTHKYHYPKTMYCMKIYLPVKLRQYWLIYYVTMRLAENS